MAIGRLFRLVPNRRVCRLIDFCLRAAASDFEGRIKLHEYLFLSNHYHLLLTDVAGVLPAFMGKLNALLSSNLNAMRGTTGRNFEGYTKQFIDADDFDRQLEASVYILNNAASANLVTRCKHWKGVSSFKLRYGEPSSATKPAYGIWSNKLQHLSRSASRRSGRAKYGGRSKYGQSLSLTLHPLPAVECQGADERELADHRAVVLDALAAAESALIGERRATNQGVVGWRRVETAHFNTMPAQGRELFDNNPTFAASTPARRTAAAKRMEAFYVAYYAALRRFNEGDRDVEFPAGTWLMVQRHNVRVASPDP